MNTINYNKSIQKFCITGGSLFVIAISIVFMGACRKTSPASDHSESHDDHVHSVSADHDHGEEIHEHADEHDHDMPQAHDHEQEEHVDAEHVDESEHDHKHDETRTADHDQAGSGEVIDVSPVVRQNLGITFVKAEQRPVSRTLRLPGQFELRPSARREYRTMLSGRVQLNVAQYQEVKEGTLLFTLHSPEWQQLQQSLVEAYTAMIRSHSNVEVAEATLQEAEQAVVFLEQRIDNLQKASMRQADLEAQLAEKKNTIPRLKLEVQAARTDSEADHLQYAVLLNRASSVTGIGQEKLDSQVGHHRHPGDTLPEWSRIAELKIMAEVSGIVDRMDVTDNGWVETGNLVLNTLDPDDIRFHADALQGDINVLHDNLPARIIPPPGGTMDPMDTTDASIRVGIRAHPGQRTIPVYVTPQKKPQWAKAGVTAFLDVFLNGPDEAQIAIPQSCIIRDGLQHVFFLRSHDNPDQVIRIPARIKASDGYWVAVDNDLHVGDQVVLNGVYPLMLAGGTKDNAGEPAGHFHADGTFHESNEH